MPLNRAMYSLPSPTVFSAAEVGQQIISFPVINWQPCPHSVTLARHPSKSFLLHRCLGCLGRSHRTICCWFCQLCVHMIRILVSWMRSSAQLHTYIMLCCSVLCRCGPHTVRQTFLRCVHTCKPAPLDDWSIAQCASDFCMFFC